MKIRKNTSETLKKKGPHSNSGKKFGKILKIRKNTLENSEKYLQKFGKILQKFGKILQKFGKILRQIRKNTSKNQDPGRKITFSDY